MCFGAPGNFVGEDKPVETGFKATKRLRPTFVKSKFERMKAE